MLACERVSKSYPIHRSFWGRAAGWVRAVDGVTLSVPARQKIGLVGESGSGKSTLARILAGLEHPSSGRVQWDGQELDQFGRRKSIDFRRHVQVIWQDPYQSLNPRWTVESLLSEPLWIHHRARRSVAQTKVRAALQAVGLESNIGCRHPHQLSGGQRQRVAIARALILEPALLICDEPVSQLDVSVGAQILDLLEQIHRARRVTFLFISHDLAVVSQFCETVHVMERGRIVETLPARGLQQHARHPYTLRLLDSLPRMKRQRRPGAIDDMSRPG